MRFQTHSSATWTTTLGAVLMLALPVTAGAQPRVATEGQVSRTLQATSTSRAAATSTFTYQGVLEENGQPVDGDRQMTFTLYSDATCSTMVGSGIMQTVTVSDGTFTVELGFTPTAFNGQELWLQTQVEGTNVACQPLRAAPLANTVRPGALIKAGVSNDEQLLDLRSGDYASISNEALFGAKIGHVTSSGFPVGVYGYGHYDGSVGVWGVTEARYAVGVAGVHNGASNEAYGVYGEANSPDGYAGYFENTASTAPGWGLFAQGVSGATITGTGGTGLMASASGDSAVGDDAVQAVHSTGDGVTGESEGAGNLDNGVIGFSAGGYGVYGFSNATGQYGGYFDDPIFVNGGCTGCSTRYVARNSSDTTLRLGDVVTAAGVDATTAGAEQPVILTAPATKGDSVLGVVVGRTTMTIADDSEDDVKPGAHYGPTGGPAAPGDYVVVVVQGMAQVRVDPAAAISTGEQLQVGQNGATRASDGAEFAMMLDDASKTRSGLVWALLGAP